MIKNIIIAVLLLSLAAAGAFFYFGKAEEVTKLLSSSSASKTEPELQIYMIEKVLLTLPEPGEPKLHHAELDVVLTSFDPQAVEIFKKMDPLLRNVIIETSSQKTFSQLKQINDINLLESDIQTAFEALFVKYKVKTELLDVKLSKIILQ